MRTLQAQADVARREGNRLDEGVTVLYLAFSYLLQRDPRYFPEPLRFHPERWTAQFKAALPKYAYFPFAGGPRGCIGEGFAWTEMTLVIATLAQRWKLRLAPGSRVVPQPLLTLRPKYGLSMTALRR